MKEHYLLARLLCRSSMDTLELFSYFAIFHSLSYSRHNRIALVRHFIITDAADDFIIGYFPS